MYDGESQKEGESTCRPGAGSSQTERHGVPEGGGLQIYQYEEHFVLNQRQHTGLPVVRYTLTHFAFQSEMAVIFIPMVLESYQQGIKLNRS